MRKRDHSIIVRLNGSELHHLKQQVEKTGLSREVYLRKLIMCKEVRERPPPRDCIELLQEVRGQSKLLNAIAQDAMNQGFVDERQVMRLLDGYKDLLVAAKQLV